MNRGRRAAFTVALGGLAVLSHSVLVNPWMAQWGSTRSERERAFPGALVHGALREETRAISIDAPAAVVWAWLGQIGQGRGGFYSYDWLENLVGANIHNIAELRAELGPPRAGDTIRLVPDGYLGGRLKRFTALPVVGAEAGRSFVLKGWGTFVVDSIGPGTSRLIVRDRYPADESWWVAGVRRVAFAPAHFVMERQMLRGIRDRAEGRPPRPLARALAFAGFAASAIVLAWVLVQRSHRLWLALAAAVPVAVIFSTGDPESALAGFVGIALPVVAADELRARRWLTLILLAGIAWTILVFAPDAYLVFGWLLGGVTLAGVFTGLWLTAEPPETDELPLIAR